MEEKLIFIEEFIKQGLYIPSLISYYQEYYIENKIGTGESIARDAIIGLAILFGE